MHAAVVALRGAGVPRALTAAVVQQVCGTSGHAFVGLTKYTFVVLACLVVFVSCICCSFTFSHAASDVMHAAVVALRAAGVPRAFTAAVTYIRLVWRALCMCVMFGL
jgi:hypothetical protein